MLRVGVAASAVALSVPSTAFAGTVESTWALVGASVDRHAIVVAPVAMPRDGGTVEIVDKSDALVSLRLTLPDLSGSQQPTFVTDDLIVDPKPTYVVKLPWQLAGQQLTGTGRVTTSFDSFSWNAWRGKPQSQVYDPNARYRAPSTIGLNVADAAQIVTGLGVPTGHIKISGPNHGYVVRQRPSRTGWIDPRRARVTFVTRALP